MKLALIILVVGMLCIAGVSYIGIYSEKIVSEDKIYSGPVRPTDDEQYFRRTGITIPLNNG